MLHKVTKSSVALNALARRVTRRPSCMTRGVVSVEPGNRSNNDLYDVIIAGGGMVGSAMACSLGE